jgi:hypothetical protein
VLDLLEHLVDKSMVTVEETGGRGVAGETRYRLLESIRQYGLDALRARGELDAVQDARLAWCARFASRAERQLVGADQADWFTRLEDEQGNLRGALEFVFEHPTPERVESGRVIGAGSWRFWLACGRVAEGRRLLVRLDKASEGDEATAAWARVREGIGAIATATGDLVHAVAYGRAGLEMARHNGDERTIAGLLACLGSACLGDGIPARAHDYYDESLQIRRSMGDRVLTSASLCGLGLCALEMDEPGRAESLLSDAEQTLRGAGGGLQVAEVHAAFARLAIARGDGAGAAARLGQAASLRTAVGAMTGVPWLLELYACVAVLGEDAEKSVRLFAAAAKGRERLAVPRRPSEDALCEGFASSVSDRVPADRRAVLEGEGRKMPLRRALRYAKGEG